MTTKCAASIHNQTTLQKCCNRIHCKAFLATENVLSLAHFNFGYKSFEFVTFLWCFSHFGFGSSNIFGKKKLQTISFRSHLREIRDRSVLRLFESNEVNAPQALPGGPGVPQPLPQTGTHWDQDQVLTK